jgi:signal transduction histidine kinase
MRLPTKERFPGSASLGVLTIVLLTLAVLQYRWSGEVSQAASTRMQASLDTSIRGFKHDFYQELGAVCFPFQTSFVSDPDWNRYARRYDEWSSSDLVANIFVWQTDRGKASGLLRLNLTTKHFELAQWPPELTSFRDRVASVVGRPDSLASSTPLESLQGYRLEGSRIPDAGVNRLAWEIDQSIPALLHPLVQFATSPGQQDGGEARIIGWVMIELNSKTLRTRLLPELVQRYFSDRNGPIYNVAVIEGEDSSTVIYSSNRDFGKGHNSVDVMQNLMSNLSLQNPAEPEMLVSRQGVLRDSDAPIVFPSWGTYRPGGPPILQVLRYSPGEREWQLLVRNRQGSLESMVAGLRRRTLIISFSVLLLLTASIAMLFVTSQRARKLGKLQMDFVACVSHELRTPVAVICSTADNLAAGVVEGKKQVMRYGGVIRNQAHQLADLVERILLFAALRGDALPYTLRPLQISEVVERAMTNIAGMLAASGITVERRLDADLPPVMGDMDALVQCVQNLLTNAAKYGDDQQWIGVWTGISQNGRQEPCVEVTVQDRGRGIEPSELNHIFEPFYRGRAAAAKQIRGTGLGLALAKNVAQAMRGGLTVKSTVGAGSMFTLHLPAAKADRTVQLAVEHSPNTGLVKS